MLIVQKYGGTSVGSIDRMKHVAARCLATQRQGHKVAVVVSAMAGKTNELVAWCRKNLAGYKVPRTIVFAELPKTSTGKIQKFKLREMAKAV